MLKHITHRNKSIPSSFGDIVIDGEGNVTSEFTEEQQQFLLGIPGYFREGHEEEAGTPNDLKSIEDDLVNKLPKEIVEHLPNNKEDKEEEEAVEIKKYDEITVADLEKELKAEGVDFDNKAKKKEKYDLYVKAKQK